MGKARVDRADIERRLKAAMVAGGESEDRAELFLPVIIEDIESGELSEADFTEGLQRLWRGGVQRVNVEDIAAHVEQMPDGPEKDSLRQALVDHKEAGPPE